MVTSAKPRHRRKSIPSWHIRFLAMLPGIETYAKIAFLHLDREARQEAVQEVVCNACCATARLAELGKLDLAYSTVLARYGVAQTNDGRRVGTKSNVRDVSSPYAQMQKGFQIERLDRYDKTDDQRQEILVEDRHAGPAETAASRIDFPAWLDTLNRRDRRIALKLGAGERTSAVAKMFQVSQGRISQIRSELAASWCRFVGDVEPREAAASAA